MTVTLDEATDAVLEELAELLERDAIGLRNELAAKGTEMPCDSFLLWEVMVRVEERLGVPEVAVEGLSSREFASVWSVATLLADTANGLR